LELRKRCVAKAKGYVRFGYGNTIRIVSGEIARSVGWRAEDWRLWEDWGWRKGKRSLRISCWCTRFGRDGKRGAGAKYVFKGW